MRFNDDNTSEERGNGSTEERFTPCLKPGLPLVVRPRIGAWCSWACDVIIGEPLWGYPVEENILHFAHGHGADFRVSGCIEK
jgi:hypothetical protein